MDELTQQVKSAVSDPEIPAEEKALVSRWQRRLEDSRKGDKPFRENVRRDRAFASGEALAGYEVSTNLVQATIDTLIPFLYAKDPDVDVVAQDQVSPPVKPRAMPPQPPGPPIDPATGQPMMAPDGLPISPDPEAMAQYQLAMAQFQAQQQAEHEQAEAERERNDFVRRLGQTIEIVVSRLWHKAKLKAEAKRWLRAGMTSAEGWLKCSLHGDLLTDPTVQKELYSLQEQLEALEAQRRVVEDDAVCKNLDEAVAELNAKIVGIEGRVETYVARCLVIDWVDTLDMQWPSSLRTISEYVNSPWGADASYYSLEEARAKFPDLTERDWAAATRWKPAETRPDESAATDRTFSDEAWTRASDSDSKGSVRVWEIHSREDNVIFTWAEGTARWAKAPRPPRFTTSRFYPYFLLALYEVDGSRHSQSLAYRLAKLQDEYAITRSNFAEVRRRAKQGVLVDGTNLDEDNVRKIRDGENQELIVVKPVRPDQPLANSFAPKPFNRVDPGLYDTTPIRADMESVSGAQDALRAGVQQPKTATEAEIESAGSTARTGYSRDALDMAFDDLAQYCAELALQGFNVEQVKKWAGPHAVWPQGVPSEELEALVHVAIRAGSTGKPNTTAERNAWSAIMPMLQALIGQIGQLRGADPQEMADKLTELLRETVLRTGDRIDVDRFLPMPSPNAQATGVPQIGPMVPPQSAPALTEPPPAVPAQP